MACDLYHGYVFISLCHPFQWEEGELEMLLASTALDARLSMCGLAVLVSLGFPAHAGRGLRFSALMIVKLLLHSLFESRFLKGNIFIPGPSAQA